MSLPEEFRDYLDTVETQVRWKRARPLLSAELQTHLLDQYDACLGAGLDEERAQAETLRQMGDAVEVGTALDRAHRPKAQWGLLILTGILVVVGVVLQFFVLSDPVTDNRGLYSYAGQVLAVCLGLGCMLGLYFLDYTLLGKRPWLIYLGTVILTVLLLFTKHVNGIPIYTRYVLLFAPVAYGIALYALRGKRTWGVLLGMGALLPLLALAWRVPSASNFLILLGSGVVLLLLSIAKGWFGGRKTVQFCCVLAPIVAFAALLWMWSPPFILRRLTIALHPETDPFGYGFQGVALRSYLSGAKLIGAGAPNPYDDSYVLNGLDFVLTWVIHRAGWLAGGGILLLLAALLLWGFLLCKRQKGMLGRLVGTAVMLILSWQIFLYVSFNFGCFFVSPLALPLLSYGKCSQILCLALLGLLLSVFRGEALPHVTPAQSPRRPHPARVSWQDGRLVIDLRRQGVSTP